tara:strand:- start:1149 stop:1595 length:447 start_codon:yes stop_codon:yes gene_type:complete
MKQAFSIEIDGYWRETAVSGMPSHSGVYFVYVGSYNASTQKVTLHKLIYIGESGDVKNRITNHEKWEDWSKHVGRDQELWFSTGYVEYSNRVRVEAAYINKHKPVENEEYKHNFPFDDTTISSSGDTALLNTYFTVYNTNRQSIYRSA